MCMNRRNNLRRKVFFLNSNIRITQLFSLQTCVSKQCSTYVISVQRQWFPRSLLFRNSFIRNITTSMNQSQPCHSLFRVRGDSPPISFFPFPNFPILGETSKFLLQLTRSKPEKRLCVTNSGCESLPFYFTASTRSYSVY